MHLTAFINPNSTEAMTESCAQSLRAASGGVFEVRAVTNHDGPPAIQGEADGKAAIPGLFEARDMSAKPVIGIGQAAFHLATMRYGRFHVLTTLQQSVPVIEENIARQGFAGSCAAVLASGVPVLELEHNPDWSVAVLSDHIREIERTSPNPAIILGCAGMTNIHARLQSRHAAILVDPVISAARMTKALL
jgi:allantoin racemase